MHVEDASVSMFPPEYSLLLTIATKIVKTTVRRGTAGTAPAVPRRTPKRSAVAPFEKRRAQKSVEQLLVHALCCSTDFSGAPFFSKERPRSASASDEVLQVRAVPRRIFGPPLWIPGSQKKSAEQHGVFQWGQSGPHSGAVNPKWAPLGIKWAPQRSR